MRHVWGLAGAFGIILGVHRCLRCREPATSEALGAGAECVPRCLHCGEPAACVGRYECAEVDEPACDDCCGHACEDGRCVPVEKYVGSVYKRIALETP